MTAAPKHPPPWLFALTGMPYGVGGAFAGTVMPYLTRKSGIEVGEIGWYGTLLFVPPMLQFLYAPIVDIGPSRRHWLIIVATIGAACFAGACMTPLPEQRTLFLALAVAGQLVSGLVGACNGGLLATSIPDEIRGRASAAYNIGNLSGGAVAGAAILYMVGLEYDPRLIGAALAVMMIGPALAVLAITEAPRVKQAAGEVFRGMLRDVGGVVFSRAGITGILLCLSPVGTAAMINYFTGIAEDYHASPGVVTFVNGPVNAGLCAVGALVGGLLCDRVNRRAMYLLSGVLTAACGLAMAVSPRSELTYAVGVSVYYLIAGLCYASFTATVLETIGKAGKAASTQYSLFTASGNVAIAYVGLVDTRFHEEHGVEGVIGADAVLNIAGVVVLGLVFWRLGSFGKWRRAR